MSRREFSKKYNDQFLAEYGELYQEADEKLRELSGKSAIAVFGKTGCGKSTSLSYLLGLQIEKFINEENGKIEYRVKKEDEDKAALIGHGVDSTTLYPQPFLLKNGSYLLDTAGLGDTRGKAPDLYVSSALKQVSELASMKGIVMVVTYSAIMENRASDFKVLFKQLKTLLPSVCEKNLTFCVTNTKSEHDPFSDDKIKGFITTEITKIMVSTDTLEDDRSALASISAKNIFLMRDLENVQRQATMCDAFLSYIVGMTGFGKEKLNFVMDRGDKADLRDMLVGKINVPLSDLKNIDALKLALQKSRASLVVTEEALPALKQLDQNMKHLMVGLDHAKAEKDELNANCAVLESRANEETEVPVEMPSFDISKLRGLGVTGGVLRKTFSYVPSEDEKIVFHDLKHGKHIRILNKDLAKGSFEYEMRYEITGSETEDKIQDEISLVCLERNTFAHQNIKNQIVAQLAEVNNFIASCEKGELQAQQDAVMRKILEVKGQLQGSLSSDVLTSDCETIIGALEKSIREVKQQVHQNRSQLRALQENISEEVNIHRATAAIVERTGLGNENADLKAFATLLEKHFSASASVVSIVSGCSSAMFSRTHSAQTSGQNSPRGECYSMKR